MRTLRHLVVMAGVLVSSAGMVAADEAKTPVSAAMLLSIVSSPMDVRRSAFDEAFKQPAAVKVDGTGEVLPDGSVRYGRTIITVRNPCPPGDHFELPLLPGRRR
jgi:hypothetical protein